VLPRLKTVEGEDLDEFKTRAAEEVIAVRTTTTTTTAATTAVTTATATTDWPQQK